MACFEKDKPTKVFAQDRLPRLKLVHALAFHEPVEQDFMHALPLSHEER